MLIRRERAVDSAAIRQVHLAAFDRPELAGAEAPEARLVDALREDGDAVPALSLVAEHDGEVVGHVVCSRARIGDRPSLGLGPIGIRPDRQRAGIGTALMHAVIGGADALDEPTIVLLGDPAFYPRFGFEPAVDHGITPPEDWSREHFMVRRLTAWSRAERGPFHYAAAFSRV
jgi:putative acetyltransferase